MRALAPAIRNGAPLVSVVVPCHGEGRYLDDCLGSLREQTYPELEIFVIDDAGTDDSFGVAAELAALDERVAVLRTTENVGLGAVRNIITARAHGDLMLYLDGDDWIPPDAIAQRVQTFAQIAANSGVEASRVAGVYGDWQHTTAAPAPAELQRSSRRMGTIDLDTSRGGNVFIVSAPLVRRDVMVETGGFTEGIVGGEDHLGWLRVLTSGYVFVPCGALVAYYRQKPQSMLRSSTATLTAAAVAGREHMARQTGSPPTPDTFIDAPLARHKAGEVVLRWGRPRVSRTRPAATPSPASTAPSLPPMTEPGPAPAIELSDPLELVRQQASAFLEHGNTSPVGPSVTALERHRGNISFRKGGDPAIIITAGSDAGAVAAVLAARLAAQTGLTCRLEIGRAVRAACHALVGLMDPDAWPSLSTSSTGKAGELRFSGTGGSATLAIEDLAGLGAALLGRDGESVNLSGPPSDRTVSGTATAALAIDAGAARAWADLGAAVGVANMSDVARAVSVTMDDGCDADLISVLAGTPRSHAAATPGDAVRAAIRRVAGAG